MSADYQALLLFAVALSMFMYDIVYCTQWTYRTTIYLIVINLVLAQFCVFWVELPQFQSMLMVFAFTAFGGIYGGMYDGGLNKYVQGYVLRFAYLAHIGLWSSMLIWSIRWF